MISDLFKSFSDTIRALGYLFKPWVFKYLFISGVISLLTYSALFGLIFYKGGDLGSSLMGLLGESLQFDWLTAIIEWIVRIILWVGAFFITKYIVLIATSPIMSMLSEKMELKLTGRSFSDNSLKFQMKSMARGIRVSLSNIIREVFLTSILLVLSIIPGAGLFTTPLIYLLQSYYAGFGNMDFFMERRFSASQSRRFIKRNKGLAIGNGAVFLGLFLIPFLGAFVAPTICTISGTLSGLDRLQTDELV